MTVDAADASVVVDAMVASSSVSNSGLSTHRGGGVVLRKVVDTDPAFVVFVDDMAVSGEGIEEANMVLLLLLLLLWL